MDKNLLLDSCSIYYDVDLTNIDTLDLTSATVAQKFIGLTKGGCKFEAKPKIREVDFDGKLDKKVKGMDRITGWDIKAETEALELSDKVLGLCLMQKDTVVTSTEYDVWKAVNEILQDSVYHNVILVGTLAKSNNPVIIELKNVLNADGFSFEAKDKDEASYKLTLEPRYDINSLKEAPFKIYNPKVS